MALHDCPISTSSCPTCNFVYSSFRLTVFLVFTGFQMIFNIKFVTVVYYLYFMFFENFDKFICQFWILAKVGLVAVLESVLIYCRIIFFSCFWMTFSMTSSLKLLSDPISKIYFFSSCSLLCSELHV
jgi:hypothetical protein